jgi:hypothetical protein
VADFWKKGICLSENLGSLIDKLSITNLKIQFTTDKSRIESLESQKINLVEEIDEYIESCVKGLIPVRRMEMKSNKVYDEKRFNVSIELGEIGFYVNELIKYNFEIWKNQEEIYKFDDLSEVKKNEVVRSIAELNLKRNKVIDAINDTFIGKLKK